MILYCIIKLFKLCINFYLNHLDICIVYFIFILIVLYYYLLLDCNYQYIISLNILLIIL
jgi:hypothetical protein